MVSPHGGKNTSQIISERYEGLAVSRSGGLLSLCSAPETKFWLEHKTAFFDLRFLACPFSLWFSLPAIQWIIRQDIF